jgi:hypothetical protein
VSNHAPMSPDFRRFVLAALLLSGCGDSRLLTLGRNPEDPAPNERPHYTLVRRVDELVADDSDTDNPTLTADLLTIYFSSDRGDDTGNDVWFSSRVNTSDPFDAPQALTLVNTEEDEASPAISLDGRELFYGSHNAGGMGELDIWAVRRPTRDAEWSEPAPVPGVNTSEDDIPRPPGYGGRLMPMGSRALGTGYYATYLAARTDATAAFAAPVLVSELLMEGRSTIDAFLTEDGLALYFNLTPDAGETKGDLFLAVRASVTDAFSAAEPLEELNSSSDERDPWLAPDGRSLFFSSDRDGSLNIYEAVRSVP